MLHSFRGSAHHLLIGPDALGYIMVRTKTKRRVGCKYLLQGCVLSDLKSPSRFLLFKFYLLIAQQDQAFEGYLRSKLQFLT